MGAYASRTDEREEEGDEGSGLMFVQLDVRSAPGRMERTRTLNGTSSALRASAAALDDVSNHDSIVNGSEKYSEIL